MFYRPQPRRQESRKQPTPVEHQTHFTSLWASPKGGATVSLSPDGPDATLLHYVVDAQIGGKLAQLGGRLIDATAKKLAGEFFQAFAEAAVRAEAPVAAPEAAPAGAPAPPASGQTSEGWLPRLVAALRRLLGLERAAQSS